MSGNCFLRNANLSTDLGDPSAVAIDSTGKIYVTDSFFRRVVLLPACAHAQQVLPLTGVKDPCGLAVDSAGNVYVSDTGQDSVVKFTMK